jgi:hypothetical protein
MAIILVIVAGIFVGALALHGYRQYKINQERRIGENEYKAAVALWECASIVRTHIDDALKRGEDVLDFTQITVPSSAGYKIALELIGAYFRVYAVPLRYARTGRLSFLTDNTLTVRAADHTGERASTEDAEYKGDGIA